MESPANPGRFKPFFVIIVPTAPIPPQDDQEKVMLNIAQIQDQILSLSEADYYQLRQWFYDRDWENWDRQIEADSDTGKLDFLVADATEAKEKGILSKL